MKPSGFIQKIKGKLGSPKFLIGTGIFCIAASALTIGLYWGKNHAGDVAEVEEEGQDEGTEAHYDEQAKHDEPAKHDEHAKHQTENGHEPGGHHSQAPKSQAHTKNRKIASESKKGEPKDHGGESVSLWKTFVHAFRSVQEKAKILQKSDEENEKLRLENATLRLRLESTRFECDTRRSAKLTRELGLTLDRETGSRLGRKLASIDYRLPLHLPTAQLHTLALSYFKAREDEKAAVILTFLTGQEEEDTYKTASNYILSGIAWYRLDNLVDADRFFDKAMQSRDFQENPTLQRQARLWKAIVAERLGKHEGSQKWLREVLDLSPHSREAKWVNSKEVERVPAAVD